MSGSPMGGAKAAKVNKLKDKVFLNGRWQAIEPGTFYQVLGAAGGKLGHTGGFTDKELARRAGQKGGKLSKRGPSVQKAHDDFQEGFHKNASPQEKSWLNRIRSK